jgi:uncharacterized protein
VVAYRNRVVMRETLDLALAEMFSGEASREAPVADLTVSATDTLAPGPAATAESRIAPLLREARQHYDAAIQAQRDLDWARYGEEMRRLGQILTRLPER